MFLNCLSLYDAAKAACRPATKCINNLSIYDRQCLAAVVEALAGGAVLFHVAPVVALALLLPMVVCSIPVARRKDAVFAPDPLNPDFETLADTLGNMMEDASVRGTQSRFILTPLPLAAGGFAKYSILWNPCHSTLEIACGAKSVRRTRAVEVKPLAPMPFVVQNNPVSIEISRDSASKRVVVSMRTPWRPLVFLCGYGALPMRMAYVFYVTVVILLYEIIPVLHRRTMFFPLFMAALPILYARANDLIPRIVLAIKRFFGNAGK